MKYSILFFLACSMVACKSGIESPTPTDPDEPVQYDDAGNVIVTDSYVVMDAGAVDAPINSAPHADSVRNLDETDIDCGGESAPACSVGKSCLRNYDCITNACSYQHVCIADAKSCTVHFGGTTCGLGEIGSSNMQHESCCKSLEVAGFIDGNHPGKTVFVDKYEITAGRIRAFIADIISLYGGKPNVKDWIISNPPKIWNADWNVFLPSDSETGTLKINRLLLGDPRHDGELNPGPGVIVPPATDMTVSVGFNHQFGAQVYADMHGNNCGVFAGAYGFPTYYYPPDVLLKNKEVPREISQDVLDTKAMNCITNAMLQAFCTWDGGQLATSEVLDYITDSPARDISVSGCGTQYDDHGNLLNSTLVGTVQSGGRCPPVASINATFDAGDVLPIPAIPGVNVNSHIYNFPFFVSTSDKSWQIAAPGRIAADNIGGWMDLAGNLSEVVLETNNGNFTGNFGLKYRGIGYGSSRSDLNVTLMPGETIPRIQRPEAKSALSGARCMRFK